MVKADGSNPTMLRDGYYSSPAWSPDGAKIIFNDNAGLFVMNRDGSGFENVANTSGGRGFDPSWQAVQSSPPHVNPIDEARFFVRQHYLDFLGREPDQSGLDFWTGQITSCGPNAGCLDDKRNNVSAAYFLSGEFQETGFLVYRTYNAALNRPNGLLRFAEFMSDKQVIADGVVVGQTGWEQKLEANKQTFFNGFVTRAEFLSLYPESMTPQQYVDALYAHAGVTPTAAQRQAALDEFNTPAGARARVLRRVAESEALSAREKNRAFVLMQYFGYLRRNPDDAPDADYGGFNFWLAKLNNHNGNYISSEMVRSFIVSGEYRQRFGQ